MLRSRVESLAERVARVTGDDAAGHQELRNDMAELAREIHGLGRPETRGLARLLQAAAATSLGIPLLQGETRREAERLMLQTVLLVAKALGGEVDTGAPSRKESSRLIHEMLLGELLVSLGVLSEEEVKLAAQDQIWTKLKFGESVLRLGAATPDQIEDALELQRRARAKASGVDPSTLVDPIEAMRKARALPPPDLTDRGRIGEALYRLGRIDRRELDLALKLQRATGRPLGESLVEIGAASMQDVMDGLRFQQEERSRRAEAA